MLCFHALSQAAKIEFRCFFFSKLKHLLNEIEIIDKTLKTLSTHFLQKVNINYS